MLCIHNTQTDPYFNLAAEEYLLKNFKENIFMLWQNEPSIVIGKHQDVWAEVNLKFVQDQQIKMGADIRDRTPYRFNECRSFTSCFLWCLTGCTFQGGDEPIQIGGKQ